VLTQLTHASGQFLVDASAAREPLAPRGLDAKAGRLIELMTLSAERRRIADLA
jgi:15-cis-phytoene synthase